MSSRPGYALPVDADDLSAALEPVRRLRLALNALWDDLPGHLDGAGPVTDALATIHDHINQAEATSLRESGLAEHYLIIRPVSPLAPPPPHAMEQISQAVRTLARLGMLVGQHDALSRD